MIRALLTLLALGLVGCGQPARPARARATVAPAVIDARVAIVDDATLELRRTLDAGASPDARRAALDRWTDDGARGTDELVRTLFTDRDPIVRRWAALAIERVARPELAATLRQAEAAERDAAVRSILARVIRRL
jgi:hypothetical protein